MLTPNKKLEAAVVDHDEVYKHGSITIADDIEFKMPLVVKTITHYILSRYVGGQYDQLKRRKPFRNIGNAIVDLEFRAKNIDRKSIEATAVDGDYVFSMVVNKELQQWMRDNNFGKVIDDYQRKKSEYGSVLLKKTETRDKLTIESVAWSNTSVNPRDITDGMKIEKSEMTPMQLERKRGVWDDAQIEETLAAYRKMKNPNKDIEIWDVEGEFPISFFKEEGEEDTGDNSIYNIIYGVVGEKKFPLYAVKLKESRFKHFKRKSVENRDFGIGVWEEVLEPQMWTNDSVIAEKFAMDLAGKVVLKTNKKSDIPSAASLLDGEIIELQDNEYLEAMSLTPTAMPQFQNIIDSWFLNAQRDQSAFSSLTGEEAKAGTPFAAQALQSAQAGSIFNKRRDQDGFDLAEILIDWVLPFIVKKVNQEHGLTASYSLAELELIDQVIQIELFNSGVSELIRSDKEEITPDDINNLGLDGARLLKARKERTIDIPAGYITMDKIRRKLRFDITDEMTDGQRRINVLAVALQNLPPEDPNRSKIVAEMMELGGVSPATFSPSSPQGGQKVDTKSIAAQPSKVAAVLPEGQQ